MPSQQPVFGVPTVFVSEDDTTQLTTMAAVTTAASAVTPSKYTNTQGGKKLSGSYKIAVAPFGRDIVNFGYTFGIPTAFQGMAVSITSGQGLLIRIATGAKPGFMSKTIAMAVFLQKGSADPWLAGYAFIDNSADFAYLQMTEPGADVPTFTTTQLSAGTVVSPSGSRDPYGVTYRKITPTTGGVRFTHRRQKVQVSPDQTLDYEAPTAAATDISFRAYRQGIEDVTYSIGGNFTSFTDTNSDLVELGESDLYTTAAAVEGNRAIKIVMPRQPGGLQQQRLYIGNLTVNSADVTEEYLKTAQAALDFNFTAASYDDLLVPFNTGLFYTRRTP